MSAETPAYSPLYITSWTVLSIVLGIVLFCAFVFGDTFLGIGNAIWSLIRWLFSPII
jgi:hypothetical protein